MILQMLRELFDFGREYGNLHLGRSGIALMRPEFFYDPFFLLLCQHSSFLPVAGTRDPSIRRSLVCQEHDSELKMVLVPYLKTAAVSIPQVPTLIKRQGIDNKDISGALFNVRGKIGYSVRQGKPGIIRLIIVHGKCIGIRSFAARSLRD